MVISNSRGLVPTVTLTMELPSPHSFNAFTKKKFSAPIGFYNEKLASACIQLPISIRGIS
jgi:hypothetical protein